MSPEVSTALHEAAHAVLAVAYGMRVRSVELHGEHEGRVLIDPVERRVDARRRLVVFCAGDAAECRYSGAAADLVGLASSARHDFAGFAYHAAKYRLIRRDADDEAYLDRMVRYAKRVSREASREVGRLWVEIECVAFALLERRSLTGEDVEIICEWARRGSPSVASSTGASTRAAEE